MTLTDSYCLTLVAVRIFTAVGSLFFWQWELSSLAVGTSFGSVNSISSSGNPCAFYSQHINCSPSPKDNNSPPRVTAVKGSMGTCPIYLILSSSMVDMLPLEVTQRVKRFLEKKNSVLFTDTECAILSPKFKLPDESQVLLRVPRENNMYHVNLKNIVPSGDLMFTWVFFLATKDETSPILKTFITGLENQLSLKVKVIKSDNGTEFKNNDLNQFYGIKGIKREFSVPRTPQQNGIAKRKNRTLIENRVLVTKPYNKTPYELLHGRTPSIGFMRPFGYFVTILNTLDSLGKFKGKVDEGFLVGYSVSSKAFRVFNSRTRIVQETLHVNFLENKPNVVGSGPTWLFDIDTLTKTMNYQPVTTGNQSNPTAGFQDKFDAEKAGEESDQQYEPEFDEKKPESEVNVSPSGSAQSKKQDDKTKREDKGKSLIESFIGYINLSAELKDYSDNSINKVNVADASQLSDDPEMPKLEDITYSDDEDDVATQTRSMTRVAKDQSGFLRCLMMTFIMFACFLSQEEPKRVHQALKDPSWIEAMQDELLQFKMQKVWVFVDFPNGKRDIGTKWVFKNKKYERGIVVRNKARLVTQGHIQEEGIDYEEVFAPVARIKAIRLFLAYASFMGFMVYQMDVKSAFLYGTIEEEVYVCQPLGFENPDHPYKVYKVVKVLYGLHQAPRAWYETLPNYLLENV
nr:hypothetical protein [Tanacetum cinerariifolium]